MIGFVVLVLVVSLEQQRFVDFEIVAQLNPESLLESAHDERVLSSFFSSSMLGCYMLMGEYRISIVATVACQFSIGVIMSRIGQPLR